MSDFERTAAGFQTVLPWCEHRTLPKSTLRERFAIRFSVSEQIQSLTENSLPNRTGKFSGGTGK
jgi:hypothetical protein